MVINIFGIATSPRKVSNSRIILEASLRAVIDAGAADLSYDIVSLSEHKVQSCLACKVCGKDKTGKYIPCVQYDSDDVRMLHEKLLQADGILVSTPVYFGLPSDLFIQFMNRTRILRHQDFRLANKPVGIMATAGRRNGGGEIAITAAWHPFLRNGCIPVGNGGGTSQYGAVGWATQSGTITQDVWGMQQGFEVSARVYSLAKIIKAGMAETGYAFPMEFSETDGKPPFEC